MTTTSTSEIYTQLRTAILAFNPISGTSVSGSLGQRFYVVQAPDGATFPYGTLRLTNNRTNNSDGLKNRIEADLEIMIYAKPRSQQPVLENIADKIDAAMLTYRDSSSGLVYCPGSRLRDSIPSISDPADREVVTILLRYPVIIWPSYISAYSGSL